MTNRSRFEIIYLLIGNEPTTIERKIDYGIRKSRKEKQLAPKIKEVLKKYGMKGTISVNNHSTLVVTIKEGKLDMISAKNEAMMASNHYDLQYNLYDCQQMANRLADDYLQVNTYWIEENYGDGEVGQFLLELKDAMEGFDFSTTMIA